MPAHRFILEPYKSKASRHTCPACQKRNTFARYLNTDTGQQVAASVGRCNREDSCSYHYTPKQYFTDNPTPNTDSYEQQRPQHRAKPITPPASTVPTEVFKGSLQGYACNHFVTYLSSLFGTETTNQLISRYYIGTSKLWQGATVFYQIDTAGKVRAGKIMHYSPTTGKRIKEPYNAIAWVHSALKLPAYTLGQCFFGEHLLKAEQAKPVAIVESEKTAIIASVYIPQFIWLAAGSKDGIGLEKCRVLQGRKVILYPDLNAFDKWSLKAKDLAGIASVTVSDLLERNATEAEKEQGLDLADYLIRFDYKLFRKPEQIKPAPEQSLTKEYYHYSFEELAALTGHDSALARVLQYQELSVQLL